MSEEHAGEQQAIQQMTVRINPDGALVVNVQTGFTSLAILIPRDRVEEIVRAYKSKLQQDRAAIEAIMQKGNLKA